MSDREPLNIDRVISILAPIANEIKPDYVHWINGTDESMSWCEKCAIAKVKNLRRRNKEKRDEYKVDGGWRTEEDTPAICAGCGSLLDYSLTDYGVSQELDNFEIGLIGEITPETAYELIAMFEGGQYTQKLKPRLTAIKVLIEQQALAG